MAAVDDLIAQIEDSALRTRLRTEAARLTKHKKFGLVFEDHLPELTAVYDLPITRGARVARRGRSMREIWRVLAVNGDKARCALLGGGEQASFDLGELVVVRLFGEPIFPALEPVDRVANGAPDDPWHTLIEADNYHALQLLDYCYAGQVDCIYIDPPYNTGARDWKYNNDYVDKNDRWRHSKWLAMMQRRLEIALRLLKPTGILIVTVDDYEAHRLRCLIQDSIRQANLVAAVAIKNNPAGRSTVSGVAIAHEYALFIGIGEEAAICRLPRTAEQVSRYKRRDEHGAFEWTNFRKHGGANTYRKARPKQFYPIYVKGTSIRIPRMSWDSNVRDWNVLENPGEDEEVLWPIDAKNKERIWDFGLETVKNSFNEIKVHVDSKGNTAIYRKWRLKDEGLMPLSWWDNSTYSSITGGSDLIAKIIGDRHAFPFPKSIYAVIDCLKAAGANNREAIVLDFFSGSGTTLNAVNLLNALDNGNRRCILVTNNEVSEAEAKSLSEQDLRPGDVEWEAQGICRSVTWPRSKYTILGRRDDGTEIDGEYLTGKQGQREKPRRFKHIDFATPEALNSKAKKKRLLALIDELPQKAVESDEQAFVVVEDKTASILFEETAANAWLAALAGQDQIIDFYIVAGKPKAFQSIKAQVNDLLGPHAVTEEIKRPMAQGFKANLEYFKLNFLDKDQVALGRRFAEILPLLWLRTGAIGSRPTLADNAPEPAMLLPENNHFAVLLDEHRFPAFYERLADRADLTHVFLITDSPEALAEMAGAVAAVRPRAQVVQIYRDYLENFMINRERPAAARRPDEAA